MSEKVNFLRLRMKAKEIGRLSYPRVSLCIWALQSSRGLPEQFNGFLLCASAGPVFHRY